MNAWLKDLARRIRADLVRAHRSATIWFNGLVGSVVGLLLALPIDQIIAYMPQMQPYIEDATFRTVMQTLLIVNGINMLLRFKTRKALADK